MTRRQVFSGRLLLFFSFKIIDTVAGETPARLATSLAVTLIFLIVPTTFYFDCTVNLWNNQTPICQKAWHMLTRIKTLQ